MCVECIGSYICVLSYCIIYMCVECIGSYICVLSVLDHIYVC